MPFTREELLKIIPRFIGAIGNIANTDAKVKRLHECGSNEDKVGDAIDDAQKEALKGLGMDPERIVEMKFVYKMFQKDQMIMTGLSRLIWFEESMTSAIIAVNENKDIATIFGGQRQAAQGFEKALEPLIEVVKNSPSTIEAPEQQEMEM